MCTLFEYYKLGLSMGVPDEVLSRNERKTHRLEMLVLARLLNSEIDVSDFFCDYLHRRVFVDVRQFYENKKALTPLTRPLNMKDWEPNAQTGRKQTIFEYALFSFASILCAVDHLNHADAIEPNGGEKRVPTSFELMQFENGEELVNSRCDILVNEFLFQVGVRIEHLKTMGEKMFQDPDPATWDMRLLVYKILREIWLSITDGDPIDKMNKFTYFITTIVNKCAHFRTLRAIMIFLLPHRLTDVCADDINWVRDSLFECWREEGTNIINTWGYGRGFIVAKFPPGGPESDAPPESKRRRQFQAFQKGTTSKFNPDLDFTVTFDPDCDEFISSIVRDNKMYISDTLGFLRKYEV